MNSSSKCNLQVLNMEDISTMIMMANNVIFEHICVQSFRNKVETLQKKVHHFKNKFTNLFNKEVPSFQNEEGNLISKEDYQALLVQRIMKRKILKIWTNI